MPVLDISDPTHPVQAGTVLTSSTNGVLVATGDLLLVGLGWGGTYPSSVGIDIIDVSTPSSPVDLATLVTPDTILGFAVDGTTVVLVDDGDRLITYDISSPAAPVETGSFGLPAQPVGVALLGNHAFVADGLGFRVIDISDPSSPSQVGFTATSKSPANVLGAVGSYVFYGFG